MLADLKFWFELARRLGLEQYFPWKTIEETIDYVLEPSGLTVKRITEENPEGIAYASVKHKRYEYDGFRTPSGKVELYSETLAKLGYDPMPAFREPLESPITNPEMAKEYPLVLTTGARILEFCHSQHRNINKLRQKMPEPSAEIHPETARRYHIANGDTIAVINRRGSFDIKARVTDDIIPGVVLIPHGWAEANINILTSQQPADPVIGYPALKALLYNIRKKKV